MKKFMIFWAIFAVCLGSAANLTNPDPKSMKIYGLFEVKATQESYLSMEIPGVVKEIFVAVGDRVTKGNILIRLSNDDRKAQLSGIKSQLNFAKKQYERFKSATGAVDQNTLDSYFAQFEKLDAEYKYASLVLEKTVLRAPFSGIIAEKNINIGEAVGAGRVLHLVTEEKKALIFFDGKYANAVKIGDIFYAQKDGATQNPPQILKISKIYPLISQNDRKITAEATFQGAENFRIGDFGDGFFEIKEKPAPDPKPTQNPPSQSQK